MTTKTKLVVDSISFSLDEDVSAEPPIEYEDAKLHFSAEALSSTGRMALLGLILLSALIITTTVVAGLAFPERLLHLGMLNAAVIGTSLTLFALLQFSFGALLQNNNSVRGATRVLWYLSFFTMGPIGFLLYWQLHVWPARRRREAVSRG